MEIVDRTMSAAISEVRIMHMRVKHLPVAFKTRRAREEGLIEKGPVEQKKDSKASEEIYNKREGSETFRKWGG